jgi:hypothetical protein
MLCQVESGSGSKVFPEKFKGARNEFFEALIKPRKRCCCDAPIMMGKWSSFG